MKRAKVVIGAAFGDEGKGLMTDYIAHDLGADAVVVRHNGGANAGHTVVTPQGKRHVFGHFGSGSFVGCRTFFAKTSIFNPILALQEFDELLNIGVAPLLTVDHRALVTTPFDVMINHALERKRGCDRHGSTGVGINETWLRSRDPQFKIMASRIDDVDQLTSMLRHIARAYVPARLAEFNVEAKDFYQDIGMDSEEIIDKFVRSCINGNEAVYNIASDAILASAENIIFEGAQGLLLDAEAEFFPHVTRSRTGLTNVVDIAHDAAIAALDVVYVTRAYLTRHGAGPLPGHDASLSYHDDTNVNGEFQGSIRFAPLNIPLIYGAIAKDLEAVKRDILLSPGIAVTHLDQIQNLDVEKILADVTTNFRKVWKSFGPTRNDVAAEHRMAQAS